MLDRTFPAVLTLAIGVQSWGKEALKRAVKARHLPQNFVKAAELPQPPLQELPFQVYKTEERRRGAEQLTGGEIFGFFLSFHEGKKCFLSPHQAKWRGH